MFGSESIIYGHAPQDCLILSTDTTGMGRDDEILHISAVDGFRRPVLNLFLKPERKHYWPESEIWHHITPDMVANCSSFGDIKDRLSFFMRQYKCLIGYNLPFIIRMFAQEGIDLSTCDGIDMMSIFSKCISGRKMKLRDAAAYYGYNYTGNALDNVVATAVILEGLMSNGNL